MRWESRPPVRRVIRCRPVSDRLKHRCRPSCRRPHLRELSRSGWCRCRRLRRWESRWTHRWSGSSCLAWSDSGSVRRWGPTSEPGSACPIRWSARGQVPERNSGDSAWGSGWSRWASEWGSAWGSARPAPGSRSRTRRYRPVHRPR
ncbi:hypothetical protein ACFFX0_13465 [Citricoccus parietis]|uniref:Uncharacterized protein n=1 Tax=Citricoccus parietis TaxID=592307 RepID=A0ABV5FZN9_9MICC